MIRQAQAKRPEIALVSRKSDKQTPLCSWKPSKSQTAIQTVDVPTSEILCISDLTVEQKVLIHTWTLRVAGSDIRRIGKSEEFERLGNREDKMINESIAVRVLLVSGNIRTVNFLSEQMRQLSILVHTCSDTDTATKRMCRAKFEGVIVDLELGDQGLQFLGMLRELTSHRHAISYAIVKSSDEATAAFRGHTNFVLHRPFVISSILRTFRAAYPLMFRERRRGYRHAIECRVLVKQERAVEFWTNSVNISETGLAITTTTSFGVGDRVRLELDIPAFSELIHVSGEVCWSRNGRAGIRFVNVPAPVSERFQFWISERMSELVGA